MGWNPTYRAAIRARDDDGAISTCRLAYLEPAGARAHLAALLPLIAAVSSCAIEGVALSNTNYISDMPPGVGADAHRHVVLLLLCDDSTIAALPIPGVEAGIILTTGPLAGVGIDPAHPAIAALVAALTTGLGGAVPISPTGRTMVELVSGYVGYDEGKGRW
jgi:hypothetical protein